PQAVVEAVLGPPAELPLGPADVEEAALELAEPRRRVLGLLVGAGHPRDPLVELDDRGLEAGADVEDAAAVVSGRGERRADDVGDEDVVAGLRPVAEDARLPAVCE